MLVAGAPFAAVSVSVAAASEATGAADTAQKQTNIDGARTHKNYCKNIDEKIILNRICGLLQTIPVAALMVMNIAAQHKSVRNVVGYGIIGTSIASMF